MARKQHRFLYKTYDELVELMKNYEGKFDLALIDKAYNFANKAHNSQLRKSGLPYILHPISVAYILVDLGMDTQSVVAALLHDVVEDTDVTMMDVKKIFGKEIANLIDGVTKIGQIPFSSREEEQAENIRKMLIAMANDVRVIIIKLADRLNNMRTIGCMPAQKQRDKSLENMEVYAPIAHRLGIRSIKEELEDISLRYLDPIAYKEIEDHLAMKKSDRNKFIEQIKKKLLKGISKIIPDVHVEGRVKSANSIYRKVFMKNRTMEEIFDIYAVRVLVDSVNDCYNVLGIVHDLYKPIPNRFKDYISTPKPNMYQSLHTTVIGKEGIPFEIQIRTYEMHHTAEYGIAAHWKYKLGIKRKDKKSIDQNLAWVRQMIENQKENNDVSDIIRMIKSDLVSEEVYVFSPKGDVYALPNGSTVIDFAYAIHSEVGNKMIGAKADKRIVPIDYKIKTGEVIEILTVKDPKHGPGRDWLKIVKTSEARAKIRHWFKKEKRDENIIEGKSELERELRQCSIVLPEASMKSFLESIAKRQHLNSVESLYEAIGYGGIQLWRIMPRIRDDYSKLIKAEEKLATLALKHKEVSPDGIVVKGVHNCLIKLSKCCSPLPGDDIIGFITRGNGVSIHNVKCTNVPKDISSCEEPERWIEAHWVRGQNREFKSVLEIIASDNGKVIADVSMKLSEMRLFINSFNTRKKKDGTTVIFVSIIVNGIDHLNSIIERLRQVKDVISVQRASN